MRQIGCLICLAVLLTGCAPSDTSGLLLSVQSEVFHGQFSIEGNAWSHTCIYEIQYVCCADDYLTHSFTLVFPQGQHYYPVLRHVGEELTGQIYSQDTRTIIYAARSGDETITSSIEDGRRIADVPLHYIYFIDNDKIVFQKSNEEVGFDILSFANVNEAEETLLPILEQLIREHAQPRELEIEEEQEG